MPQSPLRHLPRNNDTPDLHPPVLGRSTNSDTSAVTEVAEVLLMTTEYGGDVSKRVYERAPRVKTHVQ